MPVPIFARIPVHVLPIGAFLLAASLQPAAAAVVTTGIVAGHRVEAVLVNRPGAPACIVFENGSRATVDSWNKVIDALPAAVSIFAYNRPGYGNSETTATPRDGSTIVEELRTALQQQGLKPPYILVGHSLGGLYMQLFARRHPDEVGGLVLVDAVYPGVIKKPQDFPLLTRAAKRLFFSSTVNDEIDAIYQTGEQVAALPAIDDKPVVQLFNRPKGATAVPVDFGVVNVDKQTAAAVKAMYPRATRIVLDSDHQIQSQNAAEVAAAINTVVQAAAKYADAAAAPGAVCLTRDGAWQLLSMKELQQGRAVGIELVFESRQSLHLLRQQGDAEDAPLITLHLILIDGPTMYASDAAIINKSAWTMMIRMYRPAGSAAPSSLGSVHYALAKGGPRCVIEVHQASERFAALLDMFKGGHASEITVTIDDLADKPDYSKDWNTALHASVPIRAICFEFPLPQSEA